MVGMLHMELMARYVPIIRALLSHELASRGMGQQEIAKRLHITQAAVSQYLRGIRAPEALEVSGKPKEMASKLASILEKEDMEESELAGWYLKIYASFSPEAEPSWLLDCVSRRERE